MKNSLNSTFLKYLDWVYMDEIFPKTPSCMTKESTNFHDYYSKTGQHWSHWLLWTVATPETISDLALPWLLPVALCRPAHLGHLLHFTTVFRMLLQGVGWGLKILPIGKKGTQQGVVGEPDHEKCSIGEEISHQNLGCKNHFWSTWLNGSMSDI